MCFYTLTVFTCGHHEVSIHQTCPTAKAAEGTGAIYCTLRPSADPIDEDNTVCTRLTYSDAFCGACWQNGLPGAEGTAFVRHGPVQWDPRQQQEGALRQMLEFIEGHYEGYRSKFQSIALIYHRLKVSIREGDRVIIVTAALCQELFGGSKSLPLDPSGNSREDWFSIWRQVEDCHEEAEPLISNGQYDLAYAYILSAIEALAKIQANLCVLADHVTYVKDLHDSDAHAPGFFTPETLEEAALRKQILANWLLTLPEVVMSMEGGRFSIWYAMSAVFGSAEAAKAMSLDTDSDSDSEDSDEDAEGEPCDLALDNGEVYALPNGLANSTFPVSAPPAFAP